MANKQSAGQSVDNEAATREIVYNAEKDFYKGMGGELRMKAEGLFKKAKEKGISIEDVSIEVLKESRTEFPGIGSIDLPTYFIKVKGRDLSSGQVIVDGKQIDYYNRYQQYLARKIENKNSIKSESGKVLFENKKPKIKDTLDFTLTDWEKFGIGSEMLDDKEFGIEKTITGACDRIIRKLMGENDWLHPEEAKLLEEEFVTVGQNIAKKDIGRNKVPNVAKKKATQRQINYFKQKLKNMGMNADDSGVITSVLRKSGIESNDLDSLSVGEMSKLIDSINEAVPKTKDPIADAGIISGMDKNASDLKQ